MTEDSSFVQTSPDITCVIPTFNDRLYLLRAVKSVLGQDGVRVEVILVDDCSDGPTREFIEKLAGSDARIRHFFLPENGGQSLARNLGAMLASARFVTFLDQDDEHAPHWYRSALDLLAALPDLGAISGAARIVDIPSRFGIDESDLRLQGLSNVFINNMVFRRNVYLATGGCPTGAIWRGTTAGEDGIFRESIARNWRAGQTQLDALIHYAKENGATVRFLDRTEVRDGEVVWKPSLSEPSESHWKSDAIAHAGNLFLQHADDSAREISSALLHAESFARQASE